MHEHGCEQAGSFAMTHDQRQQTDHVTHNQAESAIRANGPACAYLHRANRRACSQECSCIGLLSYFISILCFFRFLSHFLPFVYSFSAFRQLALNLFAIFSDYASFLLVSLPFCVSGLGPLPSPLPCSRVNFKRTGTQIEGVIVILIN